MTNTLKKRMGRAAITGATLLGLTAAGLAAAAPASAASGHTVTGPIVDGTGAYLASDGKNRSYMRWDIDSLTNMLAQGTLPLWTYPSWGAAGPIIRVSDGMCLQHTTDFAMATCNDTLLTQTWMGVGAEGVDLRLELASQPGYRITFNGHSEYTNNFLSVNGSNLISGLQFSAPVAVPRALSTPAAGSTITPDTAFTGTGHVGDTVTITDTNGTVLGEVTIGADGTWSTTLDGLTNGPAGLTVTITDTNGETIPLADNTYQVEGVDEPREITSPSTGSTITPETEFSGTGNIGDTVKIKDKDGNVLGETTVGNDGKWSTTLNPAPNNGGIDLEIEFTGTDGIPQTIDGGSYEMEGSTTGFEILTPNLKDTNTIKNGTEFTGKGEPGTTIVITDKDGTTIGQAEADTEGNWTAVIDGLPQGPNNLTITHTVPGADPVVTDLGPVVVVSDDEETTPLMDPTIAGGTLLTLLAAAGALLGLRRREATTQQ